MVTHIFPVNQKKSNRVPLIHVQREIFAAARYKTITIQ